MVDLLRDDALRQLQAVVDQIGDPPFLAALDHEIAQQAAAVVEAALAQREARAMVQTAERRIEAADERLYSGTVTDHRTLEGLQRDLYSQRKALIPLNDAEVHSNTAADEAKAAEAWLRQMRGAAVARWNERQQQLKEQRDVAQRRVDDISVSVDDHRARLDPEDLDLYDEYRRRRPRVVASVSGGVCGECRLALPKNGDHPRPPRRPTDRMPRLRLSGAGHMSEKS